MDITGTKALVTGANGGLGQAIARALRAAGADVVLSGRRADALRPLATAIGARVVVADLVDRASVVRCMEEAGPIDVLVANAGLPASGPLLGFDPEEIDRALDVNLRAPIMMARHAAAGMRARGRGQIVFISSISGKVAGPGTSIYSATKFGLRGFSLGLREDLHGTGVGVTTIFPGFIRDAGMFADTKVVLPRGAGTRTPDDVAHAVLRAIRADPAEITVAAIEQSFGALLAGVSQPLVASLQRMLGGEKVAKEIAAAQAHKR
ncbi:MAG TPA: SDR family oxidoreductase [Candidatus Eisenbacteria bacterium]|nr:SDR family oxidoreductase [Candidatus Eisenbacteria bacterium]